MGNLLIEFAASALGVFSEEQHDLPGHHLKEARERC
jgi:hypothetical protein